MMEDSSTNHALTEVALALAMAFFAVMVLAMVSMTLPGNDANNTKASADLPEQRLNLQSSAGAASRQQLAAPTANYLFYFNDRFYNRQLKRVSLAALPAVGKVILALPPTLSLNKALLLQQQVNRTDLLITQLDRQWLQRLQAL